MLFLQVSLDLLPRAGWPPHKSVEESLEVIRKIFTNDFTWAVVLKETGEQTTCPNLEVGADQPVNVMKLIKISLAI